MNPSSELLRPPSLKEAVQASGKPGLKPKLDSPRQCKNVLLVDRHPLMRRAAAGWINRSSDMVVCGVAGGIAQAFRAVQQLHPDMVVSEILQPEDLGFIRELHRRYPGMPILVFSIQDEWVFGEWVRQAGASGYLMKGAGGDKLVQSISTVLRRRRARSHRMFPRVRK